MEEVKKEVMQVAKERYVWTELSLLRIGASDLSYTSFQLSPINEHRELKRCKCGPVLRWVMDSLLKVYETGKADVVGKLYRNLSEPWAVTLWGCLFERQVLAYFDHIETTHELSIH